MNNNNNTHTLGARDKVSFHSKEGVYEVTKVTNKWIGYLNEEGEVKWRILEDLKCIVKPRKRMKIEKRKVVKLDAAAFQPIDLRTLEMLNI